MREYIEAEQLEIVSLRLANRKNHQLVLILTCRTVDLKTREYFLLLSNANRLKVDIDTLLKGVDYRPDSPKSSHGLSQFMKKKRTN